MAWLSLSYLGFWFALLLKGAFLRIAVLPFFGAGVSDWRLSPFRITVRNEVGGRFLASGWLDPGLGLALAACFLTAMQVWGARVRQAGLRLALSFCALWVALLLAYQAALLVVGNRGDFAWLFRTALPDLDGHNAGRFLMLAIILAFLIASGLRSIRTIADSFEAAWGPLPFPAFFSVILLVLPVALIQNGQMGFRTNWLSVRGILLILVPSLFCLQLALVDILRRRWQALRRPGRAPLVNPIGMRDALAGLVLAVGLYAGLANAQSIERWILESKWASYDSAHYEIRYDPARFDLETVRHFAQARERVLTEQSERLLNHDPSLSPDLLSSVRIRIYLYPDFYSKRTATGSDRSYSVDGATIRTLLFGHYQSLDPAADAAALLHHAWGPAGSEQMATWTPRWLAGEWHQRPISDWAGQIQHELGPVSLEELLGPSEESGIPAIDLQPLGAFWLEALHERQAGGIRKLYGVAAGTLTLETVTVHLGIPSGELGKDWELQSARAAAGFSNLPPVRRTLGVEFLRGVSFSHEGFGGRRGGYTGPEAEAQLRHLRSLQVNSIALIPYAYQRDGGMVLSTVGSDETDEELAQARYTAHQLGLKVMLKPQIWVGGGGFTGNLKIDDGQQRARWMRSYRALILHYARLAEIEGFDLLCIGNELGGLTVHESEWRRLIADVRRVYHGPITYAANWGEEFESLRFWDALDYIGLNNYYPLRREEASKGHGFSAEGLRYRAAALARQMETIQKRWGRPLLFTEVGYPSVNGGALRPWEEDRRNGINLEEQAAAYEAIFQAFSDRPWLRGMFWWKWPSNGRGGGADDPSFTPMGKPAGQVLQAWYTRMADGNHAADGP